MKIPNILLMVVGVLALIILVGGLTGLIWFIAYKTFKQFAC